MRFVFKMFVLVGLIVVGKFLKEDNADGIVKEQNIENQDVYSLKTMAPLPFTQKTNHVLEPVTNQETTTEETFTYSLN